MYCRNCGQEVAEQAVMCLSCGCIPTDGKKYCQHCAAETDPSAEVCLKCGIKLAKPQPRGKKSKLAAGLLGIFLGYMGFHRFYLGYVGIGIAQIVVTLLTFGIGGLWGFIEGILILTGTINQDADGHPLVN
jgi:TM2 domain-containing membrane protein YozV/RNA polymerase subunit RPABC4/transcription elongation factor Spt4